MKDYLLTVDGVNFFWNDATEAYEAQINGNFYDCTSYRPLNGEGRGLKEVNRRIIADNLYKASNALAILNAERAEELEKKKNIAVNEALAGQKKPFSEVLEEYFSSTLAALSVEKMLPSLTEAVREKILAEYGALPVKHEIIINQLPPQIVEGVLHEEFEDMLKAMKRGEALYLYGKAGTGKTHAAKQLAEALGLMFYSSNALMDDLAIKGYCDAYGKYHATEFYHAFTEGGVFMLDEMDASAPDVLNLLNTALSNGYFDFPEAGRVDAHADFHFIGAGNTCGNGSDDIYTGRNNLDKATLNRFAFFEFDYDSRIEDNIAHGDNELLDFIREYRLITERGHIISLATYRNIRQLYNFAIDFKDKKKALRVGLLKGLPLDDIKLIAAAMERGGTWLEALRAIARGDK